MSVDIAKRFLLITCLPLFLIVADAIGQQRGVNAGSAANITSFQLVAPGVGWAAASPDHLYFTSNNGISWRDVTPPGLSAGLPFIGAYFTDETHGIVPLINLTGGSNFQMQIAVTSDAGSTWTPAIVNVSMIHIDPAVPPHSVSISAFGHMHSWMLVSTSSSQLSRGGFLVTTVDGGGHWTALPAPPIDGQIAFGSSINGVMTSILNPYDDTSVWYTRNGGESWIPSSFPLPNGCSGCVVDRIGGTEFSSSLDAVVPVVLRTPGEDDFTVVQYKTVDGGSTWTLGDELSKDAKKDAAFAFHTVRNGEVIGIGIAQEGHIEVTADGIKSLIKMPEGLSQGSIAQISVAGDQTAWALYTTVRCTASHSGPCMHPADQVKRAELLSLDPSNGRADIITPVRSKGAATAPESRSLGEAEDQSSSEEAASPALIILPVPPNPPSPPRVPQPPRGAVGLDTDISQDWYGMDGLSLSAQTPTTMQNWFNWSPYYDVGVYIGGVNRKTGTVSQAFAVSAREQGWGLAPIYVGYQNPCTTLSYSKIPASAAAQGTSDASDALNKAEALQFTSGVVYIDMEALPGGVTNTSSCQSSVLAYLEAFITAAQNQGFAVGIYSSGSDFSTSSSGTPTYFLAALASYANVVWDATSIGCSVLANSGNGSTGGCQSTTLDPLAYISSSLWAGDGQRMQQFAENTSNTWPPSGTAGATPIAIDENFDSGLVIPPLVPTALPAPSLTFPADADFVYLGDANCCAFSWSKPNANMKGYQIVIDEDPSNLPTDPEQDGCPSCTYQTGIISSGGSATSVIVPPGTFSNNEFYYWTVKAYGTFKNGNWSTPLEFCTCTGEGTDGPAVSRATKTRLNPRPASTAAPTPTPSVPHAS